MRPSCWLERPLDNLRIPGLTCWVLTKIMSMVYGCIRIMCLAAFMQVRQVHFLNTRALTVVMQRCYASSALQCYRNNRSTASGVPL